MSLKILDGVKIQYLKLISFNLVHVVTKIIT